MAHNTHFCSFGDVKEKNHRPQTLSFVLTSMTLHLNLISNSVRESISELELIRGPGVPKRGSGILKGGRKDKLLSLYIP